MSGIVPVGENIDSVEMKCKGAFFWLDRVGKRETHINIAIAAKSIDFEVARIEVDQIKGREALKLDKAGYRLLGVKIFQNEVDGVVYVVCKYIFNWTAWKWIVMKQAWLIPYDSIVNLKAKAPRLVEDYFLAGMV